MKLLYFFRNFNSPLYSALMTALRTIGIELRAINEGDVPGTDNYVLIPPYIHNDKTLLGSYSDSSPRGAAVTTRRLYPIRNRFVYFCPQTFCDSQDLFALEKIGLTVVTDLVSLIRACSRTPRPLQKLEIQFITELAIMAQVRFILHELKSTKRNEPATIEAARECLRAATKGSLIPIVHTPIGQMSIDDIEAYLTSLKQKEY